MFKTANITPACGEDPSDGAKHPARRSRDRSSIHYFTTEAQRGYAATKLGLVSRKDAKSQRKSIVISNEERNLS